MAAIYDRLFISDFHGYFLGDVSPSEIKHRFSLKFLNILCQRSQHLRQLPYLIQREVRKSLRSIPGCSFADECKIQGVRISSCHTGNELLEILFLVSIKKSHSSLKVSIEETSEAVLFQLQYTVSTGKLGISISGNYITAERSSLKHFSTQFKCSPGSVLSSNRRGCGKFKNSNFFFLYQEIFNTEITFGSHFQVSVSYRFLLF